MTGTVEKKKTGRKIAVICLALAAIAAGAFFYFSKSGAAEATEGYTQSEAARMTIENTLESDGEIISSLEENVLPYTSYYLDTINVEEGDALDEGDTILTYTNGYTMTAPYNCVVLGWDLPDEEEQLTSDHYITIAGTDVLEMELSVSEEQIGKVSMGDAATVTVDATGTRYDAEVSYISQVGSYSGGSSTFTARVSFDNDGELKLGMSGTASIAIEKAEDVIAVPVNAVSTRGGTSYVTLAEDEETPVEVETGISNGSYIEIKSGLEEGDVVLVKVSEEDSSSRRSGRPEGMGGSGEMGGRNGGGSGGPNAGSGSGGPNGGSSGGRRSGSN